MYPYVVKNLNISPCHLSISLYDLAFSKELCVYIPLLAQSQLDSCLCLSWQIIDT